MMKTSQRMHATLGLAIATLAATACGFDARADLIFSNFDENTDWAGVWYFVNNQPAAEYEAAIRFEPSSSFFVDELALPMVSQGAEAFYVPQPPPGTVFGDSIAVAIYADDNGTPGEVLEVIDVPDSIPFWKMGQPVTEPVNVEFSGMTRLQMGQVYWIGVSETESSVLGWWSADSMNQWQTRARFVGGSIWGQPLQRRYGLQVYGTPAPPCEGDTNGDGEVDIDDLLTVIAGWGLCPLPPSPCPGDIVDSGGVHQVNIDDLLAVISGWGPCP